MTQGDEASVQVRGLVEGEQVCFDHGHRTAETGETLLTVMKGTVSATFILDPEQAVLLGRELCTAGRHGRYAKWKQKRKFEKDMRVAMRKALVR